MADRREEALASFLDQAREQLRRVSPDELASRTGTHFDDDDSEFRFRVVAWEFSMSHPDFIVKSADPPHTLGSQWLHSLVLHYFCHADGSPLRGEWISLRQIPDGLLYDQAFQGYSGDRLAAAVGNDLHRFTDAAKRLQGKREPIGDAGYVFSALPRVPVAMAYWTGDDEFAATAKVFFDVSAPHYLPTYALATLGARICGLLAKGIGRIQ